MLSNIIQNPIKPGSKIDRYLEKQLSSNQFTYRKILGMLLPLLLDHYFINGISMLTTAMISSSSQESVSAVSLINPLSTMIWAIFNAISVGGTVVVAQYKGRGDKDKMGEAAGQVMLATTVIAIVFSIILIACSDILVRFLFGAADPVVIKKAQVYLVGVAISQFAFSVYMGAFAIFRGVGATKICLWLTIVINVIHLLGSFIFLNIMHLDILGTALSLNIARLIGGFIAALMIMRPKSVLRIYPRNIFQINKPILKSLFKLGIPFAMEQIFFNGGNMLVQTYIVQLETISIAANAISNSAFSILYSAGLSVGTLATTIVGQCIGAGKKELARHYGRKMIWLGTIFVILSIVVFFPFLPLILKIYQAPEETIFLIYKLLFIAIIPMPFFWSFSNIMPSVLRSAGDATFTSIVSLITLWSVRVGLGYIFTITLGLDVQGIWICMGIEWVIRTVIFYLRYRTDSWLNKSAID